jgi:hypothetical protein
MASEIHHKSTRFLLLSLFVSLRLAVMKLKPKNTTQKRNTHQFFGEINKFS